MGKDTGISWTRSTFNPWVGCTKVGPGCDACYAEALDRRMKYGKATHWGAGVPRYRTGAANWAGPETWNKIAGLELEFKAFDKREADTWHTPGYWPVFCASLADVFDNEVPQAWRNELWQLIEATPNLSWLLVTKRIGNVRSMMPLPSMAGFPDNVRILITVCNQEEADRDVPRLLALPVKNGISYEPALGPVDWSPWLSQGIHASQDYGPAPSCLQWIIVGGESRQAGHEPRPFNILWANRTIEQCKANDVPVFVKQLGSRAGWWENGNVRVWKTTKERAGKDLEEWPIELRIQEFPR